MNLRFSDAPSTSTPKAEIVSLQNTQRLQLTMWEDKKSHELKYEPLGCPTIKQNGDECGRIRRMNLTEKGLTQTMSSRDSIKMCTCIAIQVSLERRLGEEDIFSPLKKRAKLKDGQESTLNGRNMFKMGMKF